MYEECQSCGEKTEFVDPSHFPKYSPEWIAYNAAHRRDFIQPTMEAWQWSWKKKAQKAEDQVRKKDQTEREKTMEDDERQRFATDPVKYKKHYA